MLFLVLFHTDMYHAKLKMKTYLLTTVLDSKGILSECKAKMRELLQWVETYRSQLRPLNENEDVDTTFLADRPSRAKKILSFIENTVYPSASAGEVEIRAGLKAGRQAEEILSYPPFTEWTIAIDNQLAAEALITQVKTPDADVSEVEDDEVLHMPVGDPDVDMTLVLLRSLSWIYATLRHNLLAESDVEFWRRCRSVTSLVQSGNMIEVAFGYQICIVGTILNSVCHVQVDGP